MLKQYEQLEDKPADNINLFTEPNYNATETCPTRLNSVMSQPEIHENENRNIHETEPNEPSTKYRKSFDNKYGKKSSSSSILNQ